MKKELKSMLEREEISIGEFTSEIEKLARLPKEKSFNALRILCSGSSYCQDKLVERWKL